jgi:hypothetical protein
MGANSITIVRASGHGFIPPPPKITFLLRTSYSSAFQMVTCIFRPVRDDFVTPVMCKNYQATHHALITLLFTMCSHSIKHFDQLMAHPSVETNR